MASSPSGDLDILTVENRHYEKQEDSVRSVPVGYDCVGSIDDGKRAGGFPGCGPIFGDNHGSERNFPDG